MEAALAVVDGGSDLGGRRWTRGWSLGFGPPGGLGRGLRAGDMPMAAVVCVEESSGRGGFGGERGRQQLYGGGANERRGGGGMRCAIMLGWW